MGQRKTGGLQQRLCAHTCAHTSVWAHTARLKVPQHSMNSVKASQPATSPFPLACLVPVPSLSQRQHHLHHESRTKLESLPLRRLAQPARKIATTHHYTSVVSSLSHSRTYIQSDPSDQEEMVRRRSDQSEFYLRLFRKWQGESLANDVAHVSFL